MTRASTNPLIVAIALATERLGDVGDATVRAANHENGDVAAEDT